MLSPCGWRPRASLARGPFPPSSKPAMSISLMDVHQFLRYIFADQSIPYLARTHVIRLGPPGNPGSLVYLEPTALITQAELVLPRKVTQHVGIPEEPLFVSAHQ